MNDARTKAALAALEDLDPRTVQEVLGWLCSARPEAVLAAVEGVQRHRVVVQTLLQREGEY